MQEESDFYHLLSLKLSGEASQEQLKRLDEFMKADKELLFLHNQMVNGSVLLPENEQIEAAFAANYAQRLLSVDVRLHEAPILINRRSGNLIYYAAAACIVILLCLVLINYTAFTETRNEQVAKINEISTPNGAKSHLTLPDGTKVFINAGSKVTYDNFFRNGKRVVTLSGEAFFEVMHDSSRPFIVHTKKADIRVLGTSFNVKSYPGEEFKASLITGKIELVVNTDPDKIILLKPLQSFIINETANSSHSNNRQKIEIDEIKRNDNLISETAWMENKLVFRNKTMEEIATEIERHYGTTVVFKDQSIRKYKYTGVFEEMNLEEMMELLSASREIDFTIRNNIVEIQ